LPFNELKPIDLSFHLPVAPRESQGCPHRRFVGLKSTGELTKGRATAVDSLLHPRGKGIHLSISDHRYKCLKQFNWRLQFEKQRKELLEEGDETFSLRRAE
jgi:hypothetical protein